MFLEGGVGPLKVPSGIGTCNVKLHDRLVLSTAAHCLVPPGNRKLFRKLSLRTPGAGPSQRIERVTVVVSGEWAERGILGYDIAFLAIPLELFGDSTPSPIPMGWKPLEHSEGTTVIGHDPERTVFRRDAELTGTEVEIEEFENGYLARAQSVVGDSGAPWLASCRGELRQFSVTSFRGKANPDFVVGPSWDGHIRSLYKTACAIEMAPEPGIDVVRIEKGGDRIE